MRFGQPVLFGVPSTAAEFDTRLTAGHYAVIGVIALVAVAALVVAGVLVRQVLAASEGSARMREIAGAIQEGAQAYLRRQFRTLAVFVVLIPLLLLFLPADSGGVRAGRSVAFVIGAVFSAVTGYVGMSLAVRGNVRVAAAAHNEGHNRALTIAFRTGGVAGMFTVGLGLLGSAVVVLTYRDQAPPVLEGFGFGAALLAMFMRVGGGIFTKAADVGADLVGKVEQHIPEDDPRNAATIADNVGDNVGDCAGMAADLFESYAVTLVAALILGKAAFGFHGMVFALLVPAIGVLTAMIGIFAVTPRRRDRNAMGAINRGFFISAGAAAIAVVVAAWVYLPTTFAGFAPAAASGATAGAATLPSGNPRWIAIGAVLIGLALAGAIQLLTAYYTETKSRPVRGVAESSTTGAATTILSGIAVGLESAVYSALLIASAVYGAFLLGQGNITVSLFAIALAGTGLLTTVGVIVSMDTFGPVSDNAQGVGEMSGANAENPAGAQVLTDLDAVGNTTKAITKGIAIATAVLAATALFGSFREAVSGALADAGRTVGDVTIAVDQPNVLVGLIVGASVVFLFSGFAITAVGRAASRVVVEVRKQFREHPGIMAGTEKPDYGRVVDICTKDSLRELAVPGLLAVLAPVAVGFGLGYEPLGSYLAGAIGAGVLMAIFLSNSGGAWDNAKKYVEDGHHGGKGSPAHEATIIGDTVGDPFKDTAGPAINPLIKVMNLVALIIAPAVVSLREHGNTGGRLALAVGAVVILAFMIVRARRRGAAVALADARANEDALV
ncbi:MAG: K(+)-stimulated pyrophosphate-energized sodium pump [Frankiaceae bacterium]|nr:K(+)-stimulated pyrophosphate-energized sodium pump [Frankiaceae bacterium]